MRRTPDVILVILAFTAVLAACKGPAASDEAARAESSFGVFAGGVYRQLTSTPLDPDVDTSIGLFGDLNVMAGEIVVMGRYRYRVDTTHSRPLGYMTFHVSPMNARAAAVPVVLEFSSRDKTWQLEQARYVTAETGSELEETLDERLDEWAGGAVRRARSATPRQ